MCEGSRANLSPRLGRQLKTFLTKSEDSWEEGLCNLMYSFAQWTQLKPFPPGTPLCEITDQGGAGRTRLLDTIAPGQDTCSIHWEFIFLFFSKDDVAKEHMGVFVSD